MLKKMSALSFLIVFFATYQPTCFSARTMCTKRMRLPASVVKLTPEQLEQKEREIKIKLDSLSRYCTDSLNYKTRDLSRTCNIQREFDKIEEQYQISLEKEKEAEKLNSEISRSGICSSDCFSMGIRVSIKVAEVRAEKKAIYLEKKRELEKYQAMVKK